MVFTFWWVVWFESLYVGCLFVMICYGFVVSCVCLMWFLGGCFVWVICYKFATWVWLIVFGFAWFLVVGLFTSFLLFWLLGTYCFTLSCRRCILLLWFWLFWFEVLGNCSCMIVVLILFYEFWWLRCVVIVWFTIVLNCCLCCVLMFLLVGFYCLKVGCLIVLLWFWIGLFVYVILLCFALWVFGFGFDCVCFLRLFFMVGFI